MTRRIPAAFIMLLLAAAPMAHAADPTPAPSKTYEGTLVDEAGKPLAGVKFRCFHWEVGGQKLELQGATDAGGHFAVGPVTPDPSGTINRTVIFDAPGKALTVWQPPDTRGRLGIDPTIRPVAGPPHHVSGIVHDDAGAPVPNAQVSLDLQGTMGYFDFDDTNGLAAATDAAGHFSFDRVPDGQRSHVRVKAPGYALFTTSRGYAGMWFPIKPDTDDVEVTLEKEAVLRAQLVDNGKPLARAGVRLTATSAGERGGSLTTDAHGIAEFHNLWAANWDLQAELKPGDPGIVPALGTALPKAGYADATLEAASSSEVHGEILDTDTHAPVANYDIRLVQKNHLVAAALTDATGHFVMHAPPGAYTLLTNQWAHTRTDPSTVTTNATLTVNAPLDVQLSVRVRPILRGTLVDEAGKPIAGHIVLDFLGVDTDDKGNFAIDEPGNELGGMPIAAVDKSGKLGRGLFIKDTLELQGKKIVLSPMGAIEGQIVDKAGHGAEGAKIEISIWTDEVGLGPAQWVWKIAIDHDGKFRIAPVPAGYKLIISASRDGAQADAQVDDLAPGEDRDLAHLVLHEGGASTQMANPRLGVIPRQAWTGRVAGRILDANGKPLAGARVSFFHPMAATLPEDTTDLKGRFALDGVPAEGDVSLMVSTRSGPGRPWTVKSGDKNAEYKLLAQTAALIGKPAPGLLLKQWLNDGPADWEDLQGKVILVQTGVFPQNFRPDTTRALLDQFHDKGLVVVTIFARDQITPDAAKALLKTNKVDWPVAIDGDDALAPAGAARQGYGATAAVTEGPGEFLIDRKGIWRGPVDYASRAAAIEKLLAE